MLSSTNQVPATWFEGDAGIRRLASLSDGPQGPSPHFGQVAGRRVTVRERSRRVAGRSTAAHRSRLRACSTLRRGPDRPLGVEQGRYHVVVVGALVGDAAHRAGAPAR
jgi:hypothetical protein